MRADRAVTIATSFALVACGAPTGNKEGADKAPFSRRGGTPVPSVREAWDGRNEPSKILGESFERDVQKLPKDGRVKSQVWSGYYWPDHKGGPGYRWKTETKLFDYVVFSPAEARSLTREQIKDLSPLEKYDLLMGKYDFPSIKEAKEYFVPYQEEWVGLCDAVAAVSMNRIEPGPTTLTNPDGLKVPFSSADVKGLLAYYYGRMARYRDVMVGDNCMEPDPSNPDPVCRDVNPGTFHLMLGNLVGIRKKPFISDMTWDLTSWNHVVTAYSTRIGEEVKMPAGADSKAEKAVKVATIITYAGVADNRHKRIPLADVEVSLYLEYVLELDKEGRILGGKWLTKEHPDTAWVAELLPARGYFEGLNRLYRASVADITGPQWGPSN